MVPKILKRPPTMTNSNNGNDSSSSGSSCFLGSEQSTPANDSRKNYDLNHYVNTQPFVPRTGGGPSTACGVLTLEDGNNVRTMPSASIKILKREAKKPSKEEEQVERSKQAASAQASYEERAANYAK